ncbi:hypothetical protein LE181_19335 [Streptomyces sp. SCA3-4]|uniref:hypothetical protein n=1 Tax=Streptomyces sichuanensis TaxID=2871810 RepID=UPI001CE24ADC|nr:hypothetical protein [Streptomyces sichuanensis]MCA6094310.1 hypothetical protein [Streptomyces sichuanensis]
MMITPNPVPLPPLPPRPSHGLRIRRVPSEPVRREADGSLAVRLWLERHGRFHADLVLRLSAAEAEHLHTQLCRALDGMPVTTPADRTSDCRKDVRGGGGTHQP